MYVYVCVCILVQAQKWAKHKKVQTGAGFSETPVGDQCYPCGQVHQDAFASYMSWKTYCAQYKSLAPFRKAVDEAHESFSDPSAKDFPSQRVYGFKEEALVVDKKVIIMNAKEFKTAFDYEPWKIKHNMHTMEAPCRDGSGSEKVWLLAHDDSGHRTGTMQTKTGTFMMNSYMSPETQHYKRQGLVTYHNMTLLRQKATKEDQAMPNLCTMEEMSERLEKIKEKKAKGKDEDDDDDDDDLIGDPMHVVSSIAGRSAKRQADTALMPPPASLPNKKPALTDRSGAASSTQVADGKPIARASSGSPTDSDEMNPEDSASQVGGDREPDDASTLSFGSGVAPRLANMPDKDKVMHWISQVCLQKAMEGTALGRQADQAQRFVEKLNGEMPVAGQVNPMAAVLQLHLDIYHNVAVKLSPSKRTQLSNDELTSKCGLMIEAKVHMYVYLCMCVHV